MEFKRAVKNLRLKLGLSQKLLAILGGIGRLDVQQVEKGKKGNSYEVRRGLARGFSLTLDDFDAYSEGRISVREALTRRYSADSTDAHAPRHGEVPMLEQPHKTDQVICPSSSWPDWDKEMNKFVDNAKDLRRNQQLMIAVELFGSAPTTDPQPSGDAFNTSWLVAAGEKFLEKLPREKRRGAAWNAALARVSERVQKLGQTSTVEQPENRGSESKLVTGKRTRS